MTTWKCQRCQRGAAASAPRGNIAGQAIHVLEALQIGRTLGLLWNNARGLGYYLLLGVVFEEGVAAGAGVTLTVAMRNSQLSPS